jgi:hypothetical protein
VATQRRGRAQRAQRFLARGVRRAFAAGENERGVPTRRRTGVDDEFEFVFLGRIVPGTTFLPPERSATTRTTSSGVASTSHRNAISGARSGRTPAPIAAPWSVRQRDQRRLITRNTSRRKRSHQVSSDERRPRSRFLRRFFVRKTASPPPPPPRRPRRTPGTETPRRHLGIREQLGIRRVTPTRPSDAAEAPPPRFPASPAVRPREPPVPPRRAGA